MLEDAIIENVVPMHPENMKTIITDTICGGGEDGRCEDIDLLTDPSNCGECKRKCAKGEQCIHGICSMQYCNGMLFGSVAEPCSPDCGCTSTQWGRGVCVKQESCTGQISNECESHDDCGFGEVCGMTSGCDAFVCLNGSACVGQGPWLIPDESSSSSSSPPFLILVLNFFRAVERSTLHTLFKSAVTTSKSATKSASNPAEATPTAKPGTVGWVLALHSEEEFTNYWINDWSDLDIFLKVNGRKAVRTRCVTVEETSYAAGLKDSSQIDPHGNALGFESTPAEGPNACCFAWYGDDECSEVSNTGQFCGNGMATFTFPVRSWKVYGCNGWWTGPPEK
ncbi:hypothetical protein B0T10DRAFT_141638 [Thelonectria olida]|uniref:Uncharacterized protein n=1 Tax=Thelonectria olida TaxID=1576542 RepID=A0A9P9ALK9_9HYPO|nr:hypothetical protein B0T10DRAFT_141638 [Thelonectria olida]